ncbi:MAG: hypothetical protein JSS23_03115 [Proteobacteria bacterium]|nr:hypothetical protein [Pseudomonadota bacterium]
MNKNEQIAAFLRKMADRIEKSPDPYMIDAISCGGESRFINADGIRIPGGFCKINRAFLIGDAHFIATHAFVEVPPKGLR